MPEVTDDTLVGPPANSAGAPVPKPATRIVDVASDRCPSCGADLAVDQRYCVECGHRRGKPRYTLAATEPAVPVTPAPKRAASRVSPGVALLTGLATLLLALGVGVLIGHSGNNASGRQPVNVTVGSGGAAAPSGGVAAATGATAAHHKSSGGHKSSKAAAQKAPPASAATAKATKVIVAPTKKLQKAAAVASKHVTSTTGQSAIGSKCSGGAGCHNGKQTGVFFGGG